jgi:hypothetical protein
MLTSAMLVVLLASAKSAAPPTFHFAPPLERPFRQTTTISSKTSIDGHPSSAQVTTLSSQLLFHKTEGGYDLESKTEKAAHTRDGSDEPEPMSLARENLTLHFAIDQKGRVQEIRGYDVFIRRLSELYSESSWARLSDSITEAAMVHIDSQEWNGLIADLYGAAAVVGRSWEKTASTVTPNGTPAEYAVKVRIDSSLPCGAGRCLKLIYKAVTNPEASGGIDTVTDGELVIDPATMLPHRSFSHEVVHATVKDHDGVAHQFDKDEAKEMIYDYTGK